MVNYFSSTINFCFKFCSRSESPTQAFLVTIIIDRLRLRNHVDAKFKDLYNTDHSNVMTRVLHVIT